MRNPDHQNIFAVGDAASITVPKIGSLGHIEADVLAKCIENGIQTNVLYPRWQNSALGFSYE
jgi:NADH dehydrogenase FAD-containing subunit